MNPLRASSAEARSRLTTKWRYDSQSVDSGPACRATGSLSEPGTQLRTRWRRRRPRWATSTLWCALRCTHRSRGATSRRPSLAPSRASPSSAAMHAEREKRGGGTTRRRAPAGLPVRTGIVVRPGVSWSQAGAGGLGRSDDCPCARCRAHMTFCPIDSLHSVQGGRTTQRPRRREREPVSTHAAQRTREALQIDLARGRCEGRKRRGGWEGVPGAGGGGERNRAG